MPQRQVRETTINGAEGNIVSSDAAGGARSSPLPNKPVEVGADGVRFASDLVPPSGAGVEAKPDIVDEWGVQSFPASDPPPNW